MEMRWLLVGMASYGLTRCYPVRMTEQPGFVLEVREHANGAVLPDANVHFAKMRMALKTSAEIQELRTNADGRVGFDRKTDWQLIVGVPDLNYSWEWYWCVDKASYWPIANNALVVATPPARIVVELKATDSSEQCTWHPFGINLPCSLHSHLPRGDLNRSV